MYLQQATALRQENILSLRVTVTSEQGRNVYILVQSYILYYYHFHFLKKHDFHARVGNNIFLAAEKMSTT
jgi:hypothetical protein